MNKDLNDNKNEDRSYSNEDRTNKDIKDLSKDLNENLNTKVNDKSDRDSSHRINIHY